MSDSGKDDGQKAVKKMAEALSAGATMLAEPCPNCSSPLFRLRSGEVKCVSCNTVISPVVDGRKSETISSDTALQNLEKRVLELLSQYGRRLEAADGEEAEKLLGRVEVCLSILGRIRDLSEIKGAGTRGAQ